MTPTVPPGAGPPEVHLLATPAELADVLDNVPAAVAVWTAELRNEFVNAVLVDWYRLRGDVRKLQASDVMGPELYRVSRPALERALAGATQRFERTFRRPDGREMHLEVQYVPLRTGGVVDGVVAIGIDISAQVSAEVLRRDVAPLIAAIRERDRVAAEIEEAVAGDLAALAAHLQESGVAVAGTSESLATAGHLIDVALDQLQASIYNRGRSERPSAFLAGVEDAVGAVSADLAVAPRVALRGPTERVGVPVAAAVADAIRAALGAVPAHDGVTTVVVAVAVTRRDVTMTVFDDGHAAGASGDDDALARLERSARRLGGTARRRTSPDAGTVVEWRVPLEADGPEPGAAAPVTDTPYVLPRLAGLPARGTGGDLDAERLLAVLDHLPWMVSVWDRQTRLQFANHAALTWLGGERRADVLGRTVDELFLTETDVAARPFIEAALGGTPQFFERTLDDGAGHRQHVFVLFTPRLVDGEVVGYFGQRFDVTDRVEAQLTVRTNIEQMTVLEERRRIAESLHDLVIQQLFTVGLRLEGARPAAAPQGQADLDAAIARVDTAIARLRESITALRTLPG